MVLVLFYTGRKHMLMMLEILMASMVYTMIGHKIAKLSYEVIEKWNREYSAKETMAASPLTRFILYPIGTFDLIARNKERTNEVPGIMQPKEIYFPLHLVFWPFRLLGNFTAVVLLGIIIIVSFAVKILSMIVEDLTVSFLSLFSFDTTTPEPAQDSAKTSQKTD